MEKMLTISPSILALLALTVFLPPSCHPICHLQFAKAQALAKPFHVGLVLDMETSAAQACKASILLALEDFYALHTNATNRVMLHVRDSRKDVIGAASAALELMKNVEVNAIIGPWTSGQAGFAIDLGNKTQIPIISFSATSPSLSHAYTPYFVRTTLNDSSQVSAIAAIVDKFGWRQVVPIYEDTTYGAGLIPFLTDALLLVNTKVPYRSIISPFATDEQIVGELYKLKTMQTRVFVVHMLPSLGARVFKKAKEIGMMENEYAWIITDGITDHLDTIDSIALDSMQGVLGVKPYVTTTERLVNVTARWMKRSREENPSSEGAKLDLFGLRAYDTAWALAMAAEQMTIKMKSKFDMNISIPFNHGKLRISSTGPEFLDSILHTTFIGVSGKFELIDGQLQSSAFQVVNVITGVGREIGFWTLKSGLTRLLDRPVKSSSASISRLGPVIWPGEAILPPKGWEIATNGKKLVIGVRNSGFKEFLDVKHDPDTNRVSPEGYCIDVFKAVIQIMPYNIPYEFVPFKNSTGGTSGTYDDLVNQVYNKKYDAVVADVTITAARSEHVDFTLPYTDTGVSMIVPLREQAPKNAWIFFKPWTLDLWLASLAFFLFTGFMVWVVEHKINPEFRGHPSQQIGVIFYFAFSTLVFAHRQTVLSNLARFAIIIWIFAVLILSSSYTASLTSMLTIQNLQPTVTDINQLRANGDKIGYQDGSFVADMLKKMGIEKSKLKPYRSPEDYAKALSLGSNGGGVDAIFDEIPYLKLFLHKYNKGYTMAGPTYTTYGWGFVFPKGSPLVPDVSRAVLKMTQSEKMSTIEKATFGNQLSSQDESNNTTSSSLGFRNFWGLFLITGLTSTLAILLFVIMFVYQNGGEMKEVFRTSSSLQSKVSKSVKVFDRRCSRTFMKKKRELELEGNDLEASTSYDDGSHSHHISPSMQTPSSLSDEDTPQTVMVTLGPEAPNYYSSSSSPDITESGGQH